MCEIFRILINRLENIANMHCEHDVWHFFKHRQKHQGQCIEKKSAKDSSLRIGKHRIVKKSEHRPPLYSRPRHTLADQGMKHNLTKLDTVEKCGKKLARLGGAMILNVGLYKCWDQQFQCVFIDSEKQLCQNKLEHRLSQKPKSSVNLECPWPWIVLSSRLFRHDCPPSSA